MHTSALVASRTVVGLPAQQEADRLKELLRGAIV